MANVCLEHKHESTVIHTAVLSIRPPIESPRLESKPTFRFLMNIPHEKDNKEINNKRSVDTVKQDHLLYVDFQIFPIVFKLNKS